MRHFNNSVFQAVLWGKLNRRPLPQPQAEEVGVDKCCCCCKSVPIEAVLFQHVSSIIEKRRYRAGAYANREIILMNWEIGG